MKHGFAWMILLFVAWYLLMGVITLSMRENNHYGRTTQNLQDAASR